MMFEMRRMRWAPILATCAVSLVIPGDAFALVLAPPGHAGANQYVEVIPTSSGDAAPPGSVSGSGTATASPRALAHFGAGSAGATKLAKLGKDGQAAARLAASTAPAVATHAATALRQSAKSVPSGGSVANALSRALEGSDAGGLGVALPLLLVTALVVAFGIAIARLRDRGSTPQPGA